MQLKLQYEALTLKREFKSIFEKRRKNLKKYVNQHDPNAIFATCQDKKVLRKKFLYFPLRIQISAIMFQVDCTINQFRKFLLFRVLLSTGLL